MYEWVGGWVMCGWLEAYIAVSLSFTWFMIHEGVSNFEPTVRVRMVSAEVYEDRAVRNDITGQTLPTECSEQFSRTVGSMVHFDLIVETFYIET